MQGMLGRLERQSRHQRRQTSQIVVQVYIFDNVGRVYCYQ